MEFFSCEAAHLDNKTIYDVNLLIFRAQSSDAPETCHNGVSTHVVQFMISSNSEIVDYLSAYEAPIALSKIDSTIDKTGTPSISISWPQGNLENARPQADEIEYSTEQKIAWETETGISMLHYAETEFGSASLLNPLVGSIDDNQPGSPLDGRWIGSSEVYENVQLEGKILNFSDLYCNEGTA